MEYPEEIYQVFSDDMSGSGRRHAYEVGRNIGYLKGLAEHPDPLDGYSNLTEAIKDGDPIDWEKLDGLKLQCVNPDMGGLHWKLVRNKLRPADIPAGWRREGANNLHVTAFVYSWTGSYGWSLWVEGDIPLIRKTADQLEVGTYFRGVYSKREWFMYVGGEPFGDIRTIYYAPEMLKSVIPASEWIVLEEYGTSPKPEEDK